MIFAASGTSLDGALIAEMRAILPGVILGLTFGLLGFSAVLGSLMIWRRREFSLLFFGIFGILYGARILLRSLPVDLMFGWEWPWLPHLDAGLGYALLPLLGLFLAQIMGAGWKGSIRWFWRIGILFAVLASGFEIILGQPGAAQGFSLLIMGLGLILVLAHAVKPEYRAGWEQRGILLAYLVGTAAAVNAFLVSHQMVTWGHTVEHPGLLSSLLLIGFLLASRVLNHRSRLLALNEELDLARSIQKSILPRDLPRTAGIDLAVRYRPMTSVAGDYYDFRQSGESLLGVLVADVSGHGIPAALIASMVKVAFAGQGERLADPAQLLEGLNESFVGSLERQYLTAAYFVVDRQALTLTYAGAAHPAVLIWRAESRTVQSLESTGTLVGMFPEVKARNQTIPLTPGDRIMAYTDGFTEAANPRDEMFEEERLEQFLATHHALDAETFADRLIQTVADWRGYHSTEDAFDDDLTLVILDVTEDPL